MSTCGGQYDPRANVFLLVNLGCEMLYVIDQRLKAQQISKEKSIQVIHDITAVMLEPKFIDSLIVGSTNGKSSQLLTQDHCKFMLNDIAICSLMRLDENSMNKLWNLMTQLYKWQLFVSRHAHHFIEITFRHLDGIGQLYPDEKRSMLVDFTKNTLLDFWNGCGDGGQLAVYRTNRAWLQCSNTKISLLIRLGFQSLDGSFVDDVEQSYFQQFADTIGSNLYVQSAELSVAQQQQSGNSGATRRIDQLLNFAQQPQQTHSQDLKPIDASGVQKQFEQSLQQCNILFDDLDVNRQQQRRVMGAEEEQRQQQPDSSDSGSTLRHINLFGDASYATGAGGAAGGGEFVQLPTVYNRSVSGGGVAAAATPSSSSLVSSSRETDGLHRDLLDFYSNMK